jgi:hypothetical protein
MSNVRRRASMRYVVWAIIALVLTSVAPNLIWLGTSTLRIHNASNQPITGVAYLACETTHSVGALKPGASIFRFLQACGDDTLEILIGDARFCQIYVEGELYHVDATLSAVDAVGCRYDDLLSSLFIAKALW